MRNDAPASVRAFIAGVSGSGKSTAAWELYLKHFPRRILLDQTGEWVDEADVVVYDVQEFSWALRKFAPTGKWTISVEILPEDVAPLVDYLIPVPNVQDSPIRICHGAVMLVDEVDLVAPPHTAKREVRTLWRRSRHIGLSVVATTQRPESVSREVTAQSQHVLCLQLVEPSAYEYMSNIMRTDLTRVLPEWTTRHPHGGLWRESLTGKMRWLTESGELVAPAASAAPVGAPGAAAAAQAAPGASSDVPASGEDSEESEEQEETSS